MAKQDSLPGTGPARIKEIETAAENYVAARDSRMAWGKTEIAAKKALLELLQKHKQSGYTYDVEIEVPAEGEEDGKTEKVTAHRSVEFETSEKLKVKTEIEDDPE